MSNEVRYLPVLRISRIKREILPDVTVLENLQDESFIFQDTCIYDFSDLHVHFRTTFEATPPKMSTIPVSNDSQPYPLQSQAEGANPTKTAPMDKATP